MEQIRIEKNTLRITVNDNGDFIEVNTEDPAFLSGLLSLIHSFEAVRPKYTELAENLSAGGKIDDVIAYNAEICGDISAKIDDLFGGGTCKKVFGDAMPSLSMIADFFEQLTPILNKHSSERAQRLRKYVDKYRTKRGE